MIESTNSWTNASRSNEKLLDRELHHLGQEGRAGHIGVLCKPCLEARSDAIGLRHPAYPGREIHDALALGNGKLAEQEEGFPRLGCNPIGIATSGIQE